jgi:LPS-assembly protein
LLKKIIIHLFIITIFHLWVINIYGADIQEKNPSTDDYVPWTITAIKISFNKNIIEAEGDVVLTNGSEHLYAEHAIYDKTAGIVEITGSVRLESGEDIFSGNSGVFYLKNRTGKILKGRLFLSENNYYIQGDVMEKIGDKTYRITNCHITTCVDKTPDWSITGDEVKVTVEGYGTIKHAAFRVKEFPVMYLPYMIFPAKTRRQTGLLQPRLGYSDRNGAEIEIPFFWAISEQTDATFYEHLIAGRGFMQGFEFRNVSENNSKGTFLYDVISDDIKKKDMTDSTELEQLSPFDRENSTRYWLRSRTDQDWVMGLVARLDTDIVSDPDYLKEFKGDRTTSDLRPDLADESGRPVDDIHSPTRRSAIRLSRDLENSTFQVETSFHQLQQEPRSGVTTPESLAGFDFLLLPETDSDFPLALSFHTDYDRVWKHSGQNGNISTFTPELTCPVWLGSHWEFDPTVSFTRTTQWLDNNPDHKSIDAYEINGVFSTALEKCFDINGKQIKRIKHKISPSLSYKYLSNKDNRKNPLNLFNEIEEEGEINQVIFSINNFIDARREDKDGNISYSQIGTLALIQPYDVAAGRSHSPGPFAPLIFDMSITTMPGLDLDAELQYDHYSKDIISADTGLEVKVKRSGMKKDEYRVDYLYEKDQARSLNFSIDINLVHGFSAGTALKKDLMAEKTIKKSLWIEYMSQCWSIGIITEELDSSESFMVTFNLLGLGG